VPDALRLPHPPGVLSDVIRNGWVWLVPEIYAPAPSGESAALTRRLFLCAVFSLHPSPCPSRFSFHQTIMVFSVRQGIDLLRVLPQRLIVKPNLSSILLVGLVLGLWCWEGVGFWCCVLFFCVFGVWCGLGGQRLAPNKVPPGFGPLFHLFLPPLPSSEESCRRFTETASALCFSLSSQLTHSPSPSGGS